MCQWVPLDTHVTWSHDQIIRSPNQACEIEHGVEELYTVRKPEQGVGEVRIRERRGLPNDPVYGQVHKQSHPTRQQHHQLKKQKN